jgi:hypothetical protein
MHELNMLVAGKVKVRVELECEDEFFRAYADWLMREFDRTIRFALGDYEYKKLNEKR